MLIGTKVDLRNDTEAWKRLQDQGDTFINTDEGEALAKEIHAAAYCETSSLANIGVDEAFETALDAVLNPQFGRRLVPMKKACVLL